jgi:hypothetical protein
LKTFGVAVLEAEICGSLPIVSKVVLCQKSFSSEAIVAQTKEKNFLCHFKSKRTVEFRKKKIARVSYRYDIREREIVLLNESEQIMRIGIIKLKINKQKLC